jgi:hypothetical protein
MKNRLLILGFLVIVALLAYNIYLGESNRSGLAANERKQLLNRVANVRTWCSAIDQGRNYDRELVGLLDPQAHYTLRNLDCKTIEAKTLASAKPVKP